MKYTYSVNIQEIREAVKQLASRSVLPQNGTFVGVARPPELIDGIVWLGAIAVHPATWLNDVGPEEFRKIKKDVSDEMLEKFIQSHSRR